MLKLEHGMRVRIVGNQDDAHRTGVGTVKAFNDEMVAVVFPDNLTEVVMRRCVRLVKSRIATRYKESLNEYF